MNIIDYLCDVLCIEKSILTTFALTSPHRYKVYKIKKRNSSEKRTIAHPSKELKFVQRLIVSYLTELLPIHDCAFAYRSKISIKNNASVHLRTKYLLKMDFKDYFPSVTPDLMFSIMDKANIDYDEEEKILLSNFLFRKARKNSSLRLSIGAPSSPLVSNFILYFFDKKIQNECKKMNINYTRYADDLTFSTNYKDILFEIPELVSLLVFHETNDAVKINRNKTVFSSKAHNRHVTGITLTNDEKLSVGRGRKRIISSMIHKFVCGETVDKFVLELQGKFSFARYIEPDFYQRMCNKYGEKKIIELIKFKSN